MRLNSLITSHPPSVLLLHQLVWQCNIWVLSILPQENDFSRSSIPMVEHRLVRRQPHSSQTYPHPLATDVLGTFDDHRSTLFEGPTPWITFVSGWNTGNLWLFHMTSWQLNHLNVILTRIESRLNVIKYLHFAYTSRYTVYSNSISRNSPSQRFFAPPKKK